jgi:hypothetical protein
MKRRIFLNYTFLSALSPLFASLNKISDLNNIISVGDNIYTYLLRINDDLIPGLIAKQEMRHSHRWFGGVPDKYGIHTAGGTAHFIKVLTCAYAIPQSRFFSSVKLIIHMEYAAQYLLKAQHEDGTIDLHTTNFHSPPDTGFVLEPLCAALTVLNQINAAKLSTLKSNLKTFITKAGDALAVGGIHTPNHRWVVSMALARVNALSPDPRYVKRIAEWLAEKIDIDPDGQFTEKSSGIYSPLTDLCLITIARLLGRTYLLKAVRRNLEMTLYYIHADGEVVTEASQRQDKYQRGSMAPYYYSYRYMALFDDNRRFATMARWIEETAGQKLANTLVYFLEDPLLKRQMPANVDLPNDYTKFFSYSQLLRIRRDEISATILAKNPTFFSFHKGRAVLEALRFATAFFGKGQFQAESLLIQNGNYVLYQNLTGPYYQPFPADKRPHDGDWHKMPRELRPQSEVQNLEATVTIIESGGQFEITLHIRGTDRVPLALEFGFRHGGKLSGVTEISDVPDSFILEQGFGKYTYDDYTIEFGPGLADHNWTQLRGALPKLDVMSVYITGFTPFQITLVIK